MRLSLVFGTLAIGVLSSTLALATPQGGAKGDPPTHPTPAPAPTHATSATPAPSAAPSAPPSAPATSPLPSGNWDLTVISDATAGHPSQSLTLDAQVTTTGATSTVTTRPVSGVTIASPTSLDLIFAANQRCTGTATIDGANVTLTGTATPTNPPSVVGTFTSVVNNKTAAGTFSMKLNVTPAPRMLKQYGAAATPAPAPSLWTRFKNWCSGFAL